MRGRSDEHHTATWNGSACSKSGKDVAGSRTETRTECVSKLPNEPTIVDRVGKNDQDVVSPAIALAFPDAPH